MGSDQRVRRRLCLVWKPTSILLHRYLGMACCVLFASWFLSGLVMMYARMPALGPEERLAYLPTLDVAALRSAPSHVLHAARLGTGPARIRLTNVLGRPAYHLQNAAGPWVTIYADTGEPAGEIGLKATAMIAARAIPGFTRRRSVQSLGTPDQWTLDGQFDPHRPLHRIRADDSAGTELHVSSRTGEVLLASTRRERLLAWLGAVTHWLYFRPLREHADAWRSTVISVSLLGTFACLVGLVVGVWRYSPLRGYRFPDHISASPYFQGKRWHHYLGLAFGPFALTWVGSGLLSLNPGGWAPSDTPDQREDLAFSGGSIEIARLCRPPADAFSPLGPTASMKEIEMVRLSGRHFYVGRRSTGESWIAPAEHPGPVTREFPSAELNQAARAAAGGLEPVRVERLDAYDSYYSSRDGTLPLPAMKVVFPDPQETWYYIDPREGRVVRRYERRSRLMRWLHRGMHSFDWPFLYDRRPAWDVVVGTLCVMGAGLSLTGATLAVRRSRAMLRRLSLDRPRRSLGLRASGLEAVDSDVPAGEVRR